MYWRTRKEVVALFEHLNVCAWLLRSSLTIGQLNLERETSDNSEKSWFIVSDMDPRVRVLDTS